jgi:cytoplasmic tRNA 2-thiolation protein 1
MFIAFVFVVLFFLFVADSTMLAYILSRLNCRHNYGLNLFLLYVDECIIGYRDDSLENVKRNEI